MPIKGSDGVWRPADDGHAALQWAMAEADAALQERKRTLDLPSETRLEWRTLDNDWWGYVDIRQPTIIVLSRRLLEPDNRWHIANTVSHECEHVRRILTGQDRDDDAYASESAAIGAAREFTKDWRW